MNQKDLSEIIVERHFKSTITKMISPIAQEFKP